MRMTAIDYPPLHAPIWTPKRAENICPRCGRRKRGFFERKRDELLHRMPTNGCCCDICATPCGTALTQPNAVVTGTSGSCAVSGSHPFLHITLSPGTTAPCSWVWRTSGSGFQITVSVLRYLATTTWPHPGWSARVEYIVGASTGACIYDYLDSLAGAGINDDLYPDGTFTCVGSNITGTVSVPFVATSGSCTGCTGSVTLSVG